MTEIKVYLINGIHFVFAGYTLLLFVYILSSWVPQLKQYTFMRFVSFYTEPYLGVFRRVIPPIGGVLDISTILGFIALRFLEPLLIKMLLFLF